MWFTVVSISRVKPLCYSTQDIVQMAHPKWKTNIVYMKGREPEWSNPQIEDGELLEMPKNQVKIIHTIKGNV